MKYEIIYSTIQGRPCQHCKAASIPITKDSMERYFHGKKIKCPKCKKVLDWWKLVLSHFEYDIPGSTFAIVGGVSTILKINMVPNENFILDLDEAGLPKNIKILQIGYTPNGTGCFPVELHSNSPIRHFIPRRIVLFGRPMGEPKKITPVIVSIDWILNPDANDKWEGLISAIEAFSIKKYNSCVIPANVAVESTLYNLMFKYLSQVSDKKTLEEFLEGAATYSYQLKIMLPLMAKQIKFPELPKNIKDNLNNLRKLRNELGHKGKVKNPLDKKTISEYICSAVCSLVYFNLIEEKFDKFKIK